MYEIASFASCAPLCRSPKKPGLKETVTSTDARVRRLLEATYRGEVALVEELLDCLRELARDTIATMGVAERNKACVEALERYVVACGGSADLVKNWTVTRGVLF